MAQKSHIVYNGSPSSYISFLATSAVDWLYWASIKYNHSSSWCVEITFERQKTSDVDSEIKPHLCYEHHVVNMADFDALKLSLQNYGQQHLVDAYEKLESSQDKEKLFNDLSDIDLEEMCNSFRKSTLPNYAIQNGHGNGQDLRTVDERMEPIEDDLCASVNKSSEAELEKFRNIAITEISKGRIGVLLLAGGQGTRLGASQNFNSKYHNSSIMLM